MKHYTNFALFRQENGTVHPRPCLGLMHFRPLRCMRTRRMAAERSSPTRIPCFYSKCRLTVSKKVLNLAACFFIFHRMEIVSIYPFDSKKESASIREKNNTA
jgi:hypothetical protein